MPDKITLHLLENYDQSLAPIPAKPTKQWWEDNKKTVNHAKHCLPLNMANSLGYYILSPGTFLVKWNGDVHTDCTIEHIERSSHYEVDAHACYGSFVVQARFIPVTENPGDFVMIRSMPNERDQPYHCMDACIEAWWNMAHFGLVFIINKPGEFIVQKGQPIAQMYLYKGVAGAATLNVTTDPIEGRKDWEQRRTRSEYRKDLDYLHGRYPDGTEESYHIASWKKATIYEKVPLPIPERPDSK